MITHCILLNVPFLWKVLLIGNDIEEKELLTVIWNDKITEMNFVISNEKKQVQYFMYYNTIYFKNKTNIF